MANFEEMLSNINAASKGISGMAGSLSETNRYTEGLVKNLSDLASMRGKPGTIWSIFGRLSAGTGLYDIQNRLRGLTVIFRYIEDSEKERVASIANQNKLLEENAQSYADIVSSHNFIKELTDGNNSSLKEALTLTEQRNRLLVRQKGFAGFIAEQSAISKENVRKRLDIERRVIQATPGGLDSAKAQLRNPNIIGKGLQVRKGGLLGSNEIESFAIQIAGISEEFSKLNKTVMEQITANNAVKKKREELKKDLKSEQEKRNEINEELSLNKQLLYDTNAEIRSSNKRREEIMIEQNALEITAANGRTETEKAIAQRKIEMLEYERRAIEVTMEGIKTSAENYEKEIEKSKEALVEVEKGLKALDKKLNDEDSEFSKKQIDARQQLIMQLKDEITARGKVFDALKEEAEERGIEVKGGIGAVSAIEKSSRDLTLQKFLDGALLPVTSLIDSIKDGLKTFFEKRNIAKHMMFLRTSLLVFAKVLYAVTLIGLLVYILHKSGFIDGVKKFIEDFEPAFKAYLEGLKFLFEGLFLIVTGMFDLLRALFGGGSFKDEVLPALGDVLEGIGKLFLGILTATLGTLVMGLGSLVVGAIYGVGETVKRAIFEAAGSASGALSVGTAAYGAYRFSKFLISKGTPQGRAISLAALAFPVMKDIASVGYDKLLGGMANGGIVGESGKYLVGERGPEIVNLPTGAKVFNNQQTRGMLGGTTINVSVNGRVGASDAELDDIAKRIGKKINLELNRFTPAGMGMKLGSSIGNRIGKLF